MRNSTVRDGVPFSVSITSRVTTLSMVRPGPDVNDLTSATRPWTMIGEPVTSVEKSAGSSTVAEANGAQSAKTQNVTKCLSMWRSRVMQELGRRSQLDQVGAIGPLASIAPH